MKEIFYPNGVEISGKDVYVNCMCGKRVFWIKIKNPMKKFPLPECWAATSPALGGKILCPECGEIWDKR
jgi:DNA-directed RNA polymerase subunit RPC12/RpoP